MNGSKPYNPAGDDWKPGPQRKRCVIPAPTSPSLRPSPLGRGSIVVHRSASATRLELSSRGEWFSLSATAASTAHCPELLPRGIGFTLSPRERAGVRGNGQDSFQSAGDFRNRRILRISRQSWEFPVE